jgi:hypothetical protein
MKVCEFCSHYKADEQCALGLKIPKTMSCREFGPGIDKFFANPTDYVSPNQIVQMATHFGIKGSELRKVKLMATREESSRLAPAPQLA